MSRTPSMRLAVVILVALVGGVGGAWAEANDARVIEGHLAPINPALPPEVLVTVQNDSAFTLQVSITCAALNGDTLQDVTAVAVENLQPHDKGYASGLFTNRPDRSDRIKCNVDGAYRMTK